MQTSPAFVAPAQLLNALRWRYAVKKFDPTRRIDEATWSALEQALQLAPSSYGLQPWRFYVVHDPRVREELVASSWGQRQVVDASHLVVLAGRVGLTREDIERWIGRLAQVRGIPAGQLAGYQAAIEKTLKLSEAELTQWHGRQVYLALGQLLCAAALLGVDTCPMEGIQAADYDAKLGIAADGFRTWAAVPLGYRAPDDKHASAPKARFELAEVVRHLR